MDAPSGRLALEGGWVDFDRAEVERDGKIFSMTRLEVRVLHYLVAHSDRAVGRAELLSEVWGHRVEMRTRTVENTIRRLRTKIERVPSSPRHLVARYGFGYRFEPLAGAEASAPLRRLADEAGAFVGRAAELERIRAGEERVLTLTGLPGMGKTRLARRAAAIWSLAGASACFVALREGADARAEIAAAVGLDASGSPAGDGIARALRRVGRALVVLDGADGGFSVEIGRLLPEWVVGAPRCRFLLTARAPTGLPGEVVLEIGGLPLAEARALLAERLGAWGAGPSRPEEADALIAAVGGCPAALDLLGSRARVLSPAQLVARLDRPLGLLRRPATAATPALDLVVELGGLWLAQPVWARRALVQLSGVAGPFDLDDAERILRPSPGDPLPIDVIELLRARCVIGSEPGETMRYRLHPLLRAFAREQADDPSLTGGRS